MAAFQEHMNITVLSVGMILIPIHTMEFLNIEQSLLALFFGILGGLAPDLDSDTSKPIRSVFAFLSITLPLVFLLSLYKNFSIVEFLLLWGFISFILKTIFFKIFLALTRHRGIFHTIPMALLFAQIVVLFSNKLLHIEINLAFIYGFFMFFGFLVHLLLDEIYSVNILGVHLKKSFGTALKLYDSENKKGSLLIYLLICCLFLMLPSSEELFETLKQAFSTLKIY